MTRTDPIPVLYHEDYEADLGTHVFRTAKFGALRQRLEHEHPGDFQFLEPPPYRPQDFQGFLHPEYLEDLLEARTTRRTMYSEVPIDRRVIHWQFLSAMGTWAAAKEALRTGFAVHLGGGLHHAYPDHAEGFCYVNDLAYAVWRLRREKAIRRAIIIDCDVHQGNGTAAYFFAEPEVFTFSIHDQMNYPHPKERSDLDVALPMGVSGLTYLEELSRALETIFAQFPTADLVLYQAGVDPYFADQLGLMNLTARDLKQRDEMVFRAVFERGLPVVLTLGGGYPPTLEELVELHLQTVLTGRDLFVRQA